MRPYNVDMGERGRPSWTYVGPGIMQAHIMCPHPRPNIQAGTGSKLRASKWAHSIKSDFSPTGKGFFNKKFFRKCLTVNVLRTTFAVISFPTLGGMWNTKLHSL